MAFRDLFRAKWKHSDPSIRREYVKQLKNKERLIEMALKDPDAGVREEAVNHGILHDQPALRLIAKLDENKSVRMAATAKLEDEDILKEIAAKDQDDTVRINAVQKIMNQEVLARIAINDNDMVSPHAVRKLEDEKLLTSIVMMGVGVNKREVRRQALKKIHDRKLIIEIAKHAEDPSVRSDAVERIKSQAVFQWMAQNDDDQNVLKKVINKLKEPELLALISRQNPDQSIREAAAEKIQELKIGGKKEVKE